MDIARPTLYRSQRLALRYFTASMVLFGILFASGILASIMYISPNFLFPQLPFSIVKILHINTLIIGLLMATEYFVQKLRKPKSNKGAA